ncbi:DUF490 domain-containing protein [Haemophilus paracuniculus]|uniref:DUF490 domain-containing protein n=1 Tax=Haemophilus paracuniculus TaxID=734 RepID=A0A1T0AS53_9PAST|nr:translocation/assembly module TamB domain-containing protein [Haemophilus paracuniculus]OOR99224.1 DUF490 domain-containing protein [Haemophilus paracuniculus]
MEPQIEQIQSEQSPPPAKPKAKKKHWFCRIFGLLLLLLIGLIAFLISGAGQRTALQMVERFLNNQLTFSQIEGTLQDGLKLTNAKYTMDGVEVNAGEANIHIGFQCVMKKEACLENLALKDVSVAVDTSKLPQSQEESKPLGEIKLPIPVSVKNISLENVQVKVDEMDVSLQRFQSGISGKEKDIQLSPTTIEGLTLSLAPQAVSSEQKSAKAKKAVDWKEIKAQLAKPILTKLDPIKLPLNVAVPKIEAKNIQIEQKVKNKDGSFGSPQSLVKVSSALIEGQSDEEKVELRKFDVKTDKGNIAGKGSLKLDGNYPLAWAFTANSPALPEFKLPASEVKANLDGELFGKTKLAIETKGAVAASIKGDVQLSQPKTPLNLTIKSDNVTYPFVPEKGVDPLKLKNVNLALSGNLLNYQLDTSLNASGMGIPTADLQLKGKGELTQFELSDLTLNALQGKANLVGKVDWQNGVEWDAKAQLDGINTKSLTPEWAAILSGVLNSKGYAGRGEKGDEWSVDVSNMDMKGNLMQKNLQLQGALKADSKTLLNVDNATLIYGENSIAMKGILGEKSDFVADIKAPNLQGLVPNLKANINGNVRLLGKVSEPSLNLDLVANNVSYDQFKLNSLTAKGKVTTEKTIQGDLELAVRQFAFGDVKVDNATILASGSEVDHKLQLTSKGTPVGANLQISGKFDRLQQVWKGQLSNITIQSPVGDWKNDQAINLTYNNKQINANVSAHCWRNPKLNLCFPRAFNAGQEGNVPFEIRNFDLAAIKEYLSPDSQLTGQVNAKGDASWFKNKQPQVNVELNSNGIKFVQQLEGKKFPLTLTPVKVVANLADNNLKLKTDVKIENNGRLNTDLVIKDIAQKRALSGSINIDQINLQLVKPLLSSGESVNGNINARLTVGGTALSPLLFGQFNLTNLKAKSVSMPFDVTNGNLNINFNGTSSTLSGKVQTDQSALYLEGDANWRKLDAWQTRISAKADRFRVEIPNMAKVEFTPNIEVKANPKELVLGGTIDIPWARIEVESLPESAVTVSDDEIIIDGTNVSKKTTKLDIPVQPKSSGMAVKANVKINIGNDVKLSAYDLKTDLDGLITVRQGKQGLGLYGQVNLKNGRYASFGQDLLIRRGVITFAGLPSQPTLNIEAIRNPEAMENPNVVAGLRITGLADSPEVKVFSEPSMSQDQALSYILTGRSLENSGDAGSSNSIAAALLSMSLSKSSKLVGGVGSAFGISDLSVTTAGIGDNTKVVVSGNFTPRFKVKYGVGIFAPLTELTLRYRLAPSLYLQWMSSINQAVDLFYRFEFD